MSGDGILSRAIADTEGDAPFSDTGSKAAADSNRLNSAPPTGRTRLASLGVLGPLLPIGAYFWLIHQYSVNVVYLDQWADVTLLDHWYTGTLTLSNLWASHGDHRILFPNLIVIALAQFTHFNVVFEEYLSGAMLITATGLFILIHRRRAPSTPFIYYTPLTLLLFSFVQYENTLWGFQIAWYLVTLALALALFLLDRPALTGWVFAGAIAATVVGSFSSLQGLLIWPVGLLVLYVHRRPRRSLLIWIACALITATVYFHQLNPPYSNHTYVFTHPIEAFKFFLFLIGAVLGVQLTNSPWPVIAFGAIVLTIAMLFVVKYRRRSEQSGSLIGVALICYGVLFAATVTQGRASGVFGLWAPTRYSTCGLLILAGCYLVVLDRATARNRPAFRATTAEGQPERRAVIANTVIWIALAVVICLQVIFGNGHGLASAKSWSQNQKEAADIIVNVDKADKASKPLLESELIQSSRQQLEAMKNYRMSLFATGAVGYYSRIGLLPELTALQVRVAIPVRGATLKGTSLLGAFASDPSGVTKVDFRLNGDGVHDALVGAGKAAFYGWFAFWNTTKYPNGSYELRSVAYGYAGKTSYSPSVRVILKNHP
jgi:Bacterial Ig domain